MNRLGIGTFSLQQVARVSQSLISPPFFINHYILKGHEL